MVNNNNANNGVDRLDEIDRKILRILQNDSRLTNSELSERVVLSPTPCLRRVKRLEAEGYIQGYHAKIDRNKLGLSVMVFAQITLNQQIESALEVFEDAIQECPEIISCYLMTGDNDYLLQVVVRDLDHYAELVRNHLTQIPAIQNIKSSFVLQEVVMDRPIAV
jgi:Lrp/AsnC family transcriptional regulator, leucine-responsive regulatory protein